MINHRRRIIWPLLKARITSVAGSVVTIHLGGTTEIKVPLPDISFYDIREGDIVSIYTEVLMRDPKDAH